MLEDQWSMCQLGKERIGEATITFGVEDEKSGRHNIV